MKSKFVFGLLAMMLVLALAPSSFAQVNLQVFSAPSAQEIQTNRTAQTADPQSSGAGITVSGAVIANAELSTTQLLIDFPGVFTSSDKVPVIPAGDPLRLEGATGLFAGASILTVTYSTGVVSVTLPECKGGCATTTPSGSFRLIGARIDANGLTAPANATVSLSNTANNYILTTTSITVINAFGAGLGTVAIGARTGATSLGTGTIFTNATSSDATASIVIPEGFASAWRTTATSATATGRTTANSTRIRVTFSGLTSGQNLSVTTSESLGLDTALVGGTASAVTSTANVLTYEVSAAPLTTTNTLQLNITMDAFGTAPLTAGSITAVVTMWPVGAASSSNSTPIESDGYPVFAAADSAAVTIMNIVAAQTTLLMPYAVRDGAFDTGIVIANTTADPFGGATVGGATAQSGTITLNFYPRAPTGGAGTAFSLTTSATARPGVGLSSDGTLASGATWTVLLSELLAGAGQTGSFTGYIFIRTNFLDAHGVSFVSDFRNFTSYSPMLVLPPPVVASRSNPVGYGALSGTTGFEALNN